MTLKNIFFNNKFVLYLIILNAIVIFAQEFNNVSPAIYYIDNVFTTIFTIEILTKIAYCGFANYWKSNWNKLDFIVVSLAFISMIVSIFGSDGLSSIEFITSLRVLRIFKSFRLLKFVPDISAIIKGVNRAIKTSYVIILSFVILLFIVSVFTCSLFKNIAPEYFDNPFSSLYTIFRIFSIEGWYEIPDLIAERTSPAIAFISKLYFVLILFFGGILGMSLINSIFVDTMVSDNNEQLEDEVKKLSEKIEELTKEIKENKLNKE